MSSKFFENELSELFFLLLFFVNKKWSKNVELETLVESLTIDISLYYGCKNDSIPKI